ncbi:MAG TPA: GNAT family N-acetyltransferase [Chitinophagaceae bacterium]
MRISKATTDDLPALSQLVNLAYRGESSRQGWTSEADLFAGGRMNETILGKMMAYPGAVVFKVEGDGRICACVYLKPEHDSMYLGMLTVSPLLQNRGTGKTLLHHSEKYAAARGIKRIYMKVISLRTELLDWYLRLGYVDSGKRIPFTGDGNDVPNRPVEFAVLEKTL